MKDQWDGCGPSASTIVRMRTNGGVDKQFQSSVPGFNTIRSRARIIRDVPPAMQMKSPRKQGNFV